MTGADFDFEWLALREPVDHRSRSRDLAGRFLSACVRPGPIVDLGAGTGSNLRFLQRLAAGSLHARLYDRDPDLLARALVPGARLEKTCADLASPSALDLDGVSAVTAAALLDLVSEDWLRSLVQRCVAARLPVLFALNVDGAIGFMPDDADDQLLRRGFARDQRRHKGLGAALGETAPAVARTLLAEMGCAVAAARSDWTLSADDDAVMMPYLTGLAHAAARGTTADEALRIDAWRTRRMDQAKEHALVITVGHEDVLALPR